jgi:type IV pilus assembly protein PilM
MARSSIGLDIGTRAVRIAEVQNSSNGPTLTRFGRVLLPVGVVDHGEIQDPQAVATAITTLYKRLGLSGKSVHIGMSNRRVVVRVIEVPAMSKEDLDGAIRFQAQEHIPIPLAEAVMDYEVLEEIEGPEGEKMQRVLVVAAERSTIQPLLTAVQSAGLEPTTLELNAYPLVRCFGRTNTSAEAIVDIGAAVTNVVVHQGGKIRFTRILPTFGGDDFTNAIERSLGVSHDEAEALKRQASELLRDPAQREQIAVGASAAQGPMPRQTSQFASGPRIPQRPSAPAPADGFQETDGSFDETTLVEPVEDFQAAFTPAPETPVQRAASVVEPMLDRFVTEIRGSLDFYATQGGSQAIEKIVLTGGGALMGGIAEELAKAVGVTVERGDPLAQIPVSKVNVTPEEKAVASPFIAVALGLALAGMGD